MKDSEFDFRPYLNAIATHYSKDGNLYTLTDALLPLEARSVERGEEGQEQRVEQFPVLAGLRRFAIGEEREHVLLAGRPGSGKSTALRQLVVELAEAALIPQPLLPQGEGEQETDLSFSWGEGSIPVLVQLKGDRTVPELIKAEFRARKVRVTDEQIEDWLLADRLVLLLDGVNEIPTEELRRSLAQFREDNRTVPMIFTTRDLSLGGDLGIGKRLEMKPLSERQLREFVGKYLPEQGDRLLGQLRDRLREIAETPLLLKMLCDVFGQTGEIPANKGELFRLFDREYEKFKGLPAVSADFRRFKSEILQQLAFVMMQGDESKPTEFWLTIERSRAERSIEQWLTGRVSDPGVRAKEWLEDLLEHHLLQVAADGRRVEFHHQLFQEYYAAEALLGMFADRHPDMVEPERFQHFYLNYLKWTESVAIVLSLMEDEQTAIDLVKQALDVDLMLGARLAGEVRSGFQEKTVELVDRFKVPTWLRLQNRSAPTSFRYEIFFPPGYELPWIETSSQELLELVVNPNSSYDDIWSEAKALGTTGSDITTPALLTLVEDANSDIRWRAVVALGMTGSSKDNNVISNLLKLLKDIDSNVRRFAVGALGDIGSDTAIPALIEFITNPYSVVRSEAVKASGKIGSEKAIPVLLKLLTDSDSSITFAETAQSCLRIVKKSGCGIAHYLSQFQTLIPADAGQNVYPIIQVIQANCKFYNYEIFHSPPAQPPPTPQDTLATIATTVDTIDQRTKQMADQPARIFNLHDKAQYFEKVEGGYHEHNYAPQANLKETEQLTQLLKKLRTSHPNATEEQIFDILLRSFETMPQSNPQNWQSWQNVLSLIFAGGFEGIKIVCPPAGIPIEVGRRLYDIYNHHRKQLPGA